MDNIEDDSKSENLDLDFDNDSILNFGDKKIMEEKNNMTIAYFFLSIIWSLGATLIHSSRQKFSAFFHELCENSIHKYSK
jgi:hypothetical protein